MVRGSSQAWMNSSALGQAHCSCWTVASAGAAWSPSSSSGSHRHFPLGSLMLFHISFLLAQQTRSYISATVVLNSLIRVSITSASGGSVLSPSWSQCIALSVRPLRCFSYVMASSLLVHFMMDSSSWVVTVVDVFAGFTGTAGFSVPVP